MRTDVKVVPFGLWLEQYLQYGGLGRVFDMGIVSPLVLYKGIFRCFGSVATAETET